MATTSGLNIFYAIGLLCMGVGLFLHLIGLATPQWSVTDGTPATYYGLWESCLGELCTEYTEDFKDSSLEVCQTFAVIGVVVGGITFIMSIVFAVMSVLKKSPRKFVPLVAMIVAALSFVTILVSIVTWAAGMPFRHNVRHDYSFALSIVGGFFISLGGVFVFLGSN